MSGFDLPRTASAIQQAGAGQPAQIHPDDRVALADARRDGWFQIETAELFTGFPISTEDRVLDIGSGEGGYARFCARLSADVCCIDIDSTRLQKASEQARIESIGNVEAICARADRLPLADASVTRIVCTEVLEHITDPLAALKEAHRVGTDDALYLLTVPDARSEEFQKQVAKPSYFQAPNHIRILTREQFAQLVDDAGFDIIRHTSFGFYQSMWLTFFWLSNVEDINDRSHPLLRSWDKTWALFCDTPQAETARRALDAIMPRTQLILARKKGASA